MARICTQCGFSNDAAKVYCAQCGASLGAPPATAETGAPRVALSRTVLGMPATDLPVTPTPPPANANANASQPLGAHPGVASRTVLGMPAIDLPAPHATPPASAVPAPASQVSNVPGSGQKTMLGVAVPGIAPLQPGSNAPLLPVPAAPGSSPALLGPASGSGRIAVQSENRTMMGVPAVGAAKPIEPPPPIMTGAFPIAPAPPPLELEPMPVAPRIVKRKGVPIALALGGVAALLLGVGVTALFVLKGGSPLVVQPRLSAKGTDVLHLTCGTCPDATRVSLRTGGNEIAEFKNKEADLDLQSPLAVGANALTLFLDRPGMGRDEEVKASVPIRYRIRTDLSAIADSSPTLKIAVEAEPGARVSLDGKPFALDGTGRGVLPISLAPECKGMADETRTIEKVVPYEVVLADRTEKGSVTARVGVPALRVDAPLSRTVIAADRFFVAGRTIKGAAITINGRPITVDGSGVFAEPFGAPTTTEFPIEVRATMPSSAPRFVTMKIRRSESLEGQARAAVKDLPSAPGYNALVADTAAHVGKVRHVEGELAELRVTNHQSVLLVRDKHACDRPDGVCLVRILHGAELDLKAGTKVLAVARVTRAFTAGGSTVPELEAEFVVPLAAPARR